MSDNVVVARHFGLAILGLGAVQTVLACNEPNQKMRYRERRLGGFKKIIIAATDFHEILLVLHHSRIWETTPVHAGARGGGRDQPYYEKEDDEGEGYG